MKKTKSAVKYGMETLKLSPDELFKLIESSQGYDGTSYDRWLASKIIEIAEKDGVLFSQLLVKKFNIINEILEEVTISTDINEDYVNIFQGLLGNNVYSVDMPNIGTPLEVDWFNGLDLDSENSFFVRGKLPLDIQDKVLNNDDLSILFKLSLDGCDKKSELWIDAKQVGITLASKGAMLLYRLCNMSMAFDLSGCKFGLYVPCRFFSDLVNYPIITYFLSRYKIVEGFSIKSMELSNNAYNSGDMAFIVVEPLVMGDDLDDGVCLSSIRLDSSEPLGYSVLGTKRYSRSEGYMIDRIAEESVDLVDTVPLQANGYVVEDGLGYSNALGYLNINGSITLTTLPDKGKKNIAITPSNIEDIIVFYGVTVSKELEWGYADNIPCIIDGKTGYEELLYNCLPLFLFDTNVWFMDMKEGYPNKLSVNSKVIKDLLDVGMPYLSFEAKELFNICNDYIKHCEENLGLSNKSFAELRHESDYNELNELYLRKLGALKDYVRHLSKDFM